MLSPRPNFARPLTAAAILAGLLFVGCGVFAALPLSIMGTNLNTGPDSTLYTGQDAPEGAYQVHTMAVGATKTNIVQLGETFAAGTYYLLVKAVEYDRYLTAPMHVRVSGGGGNSIVYLNDRDASGEWSTNYAHVASGSFSNMTFVFTNSNPTLTWTPLFEGIYLSTNALRARDPSLDDSIGLYEWPTAEDNTVTFTGNVQRNGGFEAGLGSEWLFGGTGGVKSQSITSGLTTNAYEGGFAWQAFQEGRLYSAPMEFQPNRRYTISLRMFGVAGSSSDTIALVSPVQSVPGGASNTVVIQGPFDTSGASWHYVAATGYAKAYPNNKAVYQWQIHMRSNAIVDNIQIREGAVDATTFEERTQLTLGHALSDAVFTNTPAFPLVIHNSSGAALDGRVRWEVRSAINQLISSGTISQSFPTGNTTNSVDPGITRWGWYRLTAWAVGMDGSKMEKPFAYVSGIANDNFGVHTQHEVWLLNLLKKAGVQHNRILSAEQVTAWDQVEPSDGTFVFQDQRITNAINAGVTMLGILGGRHPTWAGDTFDATWIANFTNYADQVVRRWPAITEWEMMNEPNSPALFASNPTFYRDLWKAAYPVLTNANPAAQLVGFGGAQLTWVQSVTNVMPDWKDYLGPDQLISTHLYTVDAVSGGDVGARAAAWKPFADVNGVTVLNTEAGDYDQDRWWSGATGDPVWPYLDADLWIDPHMGAPISAQKNALMSLGNGLARYYIYDARQSVVSDVFGVWTTIMSADDSIRPKGIAMIALGGFLGPGRGNISADSATIAMLFGGSAPVAAMWRTNNARYQAEFTSPVHIFDTHGNLIATNDVVQLGRAPAFVGGVTESTLSNLVVGATFTAMTDTVAPHASIDRWPMQPFSNPGEPFRLLGIGVDEEDQPWKTSSTVPANTMSYRWRIYGVDSDWRDWSLDNSLLIDAWPSGATAIGFQARDSAGNIGTATVSLLPDTSTLRVRNLRIINLNSDN